MSFFFNSTKKTRKAFKKKRFEPTSDYFKPNINNVKNPGLVSDSVYKKAYREAAFNKTKHRQTDIYYISIAVVVFVGLMVLLLKDIQTHSFKSE